MILITLEQLLEIHAIIIQETGGSNGIRDLGRLESALATQTQNVFGEELYKTVYEKAAAITRGIIADHAFVDGNKRTGTLAGLTFLSINGYKVVAKIGVIEDFAVSIATDKLDVVDIAKWFTENTKKAST